MRLTSVTILAAALGAAPAFAEEHRELGPHVHGHGTLNIAIEGSRVTMELEVPGMDIVGFEHAAKGNEQLAAVDKASKVLAGPLELFRMPAGAGCSVAVEFATRAAFAMPASAALRFCGSEPGCTTPADMISVAASSVLMSTSMILLFGT